MRLLAKLNMDRKSEVLVNERKVLRQAAVRIRDDHRGPLGHGRAYLAETVMGLALRIDFKAAYGLACDLADLRERNPDG